MTAQELKRLIRTLRYLEKLFMRHGDKRVVQCLLAARQYPQWHVDTGKVAYVGQFLLDICDRTNPDGYMPDDPRPECVVCGGEGHGRPNGDDTLTRRGAIYCSHKCRQKAYRNRVRARDGEPPKKRRVRVTQPDDVTGDAALKDVQPSRVAGAVAAS
jgi:hypothetical protein